MSNKITQILKQSILNLESTLGDVNRIVLNKCDPKSWTDDNYNFFSSNGVKNDVVYLYNLSLSNGSFIFGLSFNFMERKCYRTSIIPKQEQNVLFSYCLNKNSENELIQYSKPLSIDEARNILKKLRKSLISSNYNASKFTVEQLINIIETDVFNFETDNVSDRIAFVLEDIEKYKIKAKELDNEVDKANTDLKNTWQDVFDEIKNSDEQKLVHQLEEQLRNANIALQKRKDVIKSDFDLTNKQIKLESLIRERKKFTIFLTRKHYPLGR